MNPAEQQIRTLVAEDNLDGLRACVELAASTPDGKMAHELEVVALQVIGHELFAWSKSGIGRLLEARPDISQKSIEVAGAKLTGYEQEVAGYLKSSHEAVAEINDGKNSREARASTLSKFAGAITADHNQSLGFAKQALAQIGSVNIEAEGLRGGINNSAGDIIDIVQGLVGIGRDSQADLMEGLPVSQVAQQYVAETDNIFMSASDTATAAMQKLKGLMEQD